MRNTSQLGRLRGWATILFLGWLAGATPGAVPVVGAESVGRWEKDIRAFEEATRRESPAPGGVVFFGSSSFRMWTNLAESFPDRRVINRGFGGSQTGDLVEHFERVVVPLQPRLLLIYGGDNDLAGKKTPEQVESDFRALVDKVRRHLPKTRVGFVAIKPSPAREELLSRQREANARVARVARRLRRVDYLETANPLLDAAGRPDPRYFLGDRLHLNGEGYARWREVLTPYLRRYAR